MPAADLGEAHALVLDVDGTLVDSNQEHALCWAEALAQHGVVVPSADALLHVGMGADGLVAALAGDRDVDHDAIADAHDALFGARRPAIRALPGASDAVRELAEAGWEIVLGSSAQEAEIEHYVDLLELRDVVRAWTTADDVERTKPAPDLVAAALEQLSDAHGAIMVGDTAWDGLAAREAGIPFVAVRTGGHPEDGLLAAGAVAVLDDIGELPAFLGAPRRAPVASGAGG